MRDQLCVDQSVNSNIPNPSITAIMQGSDGRLVWVSPAFADIVGHRDVECCGRLLNEFLSPDSDEIFEGSTDTSGDGAENRQAEWFLVRKNGEQARVAAILSTVRNVDQSARFVVAQMHVAQDQRTVEAEPDDNGSRWRIALDNANQGVWDSNLEKGTMFYSDAWRRLRGLLPGEDIAVLGEFSDRLHPNDKERVLRQVALQDYGIFSNEGLEYRERHRNGHWIWILARGRAVAWDADGRPTRLIGTDTDVSNLRKSEQAFEAVSRRLQLAMSTSGVGVWELNLETQECYWDERVLDIYEISGNCDQAVRDRVWEEYLHPEDAKSVIEETNKAIESKSGVDISFRILMPDGRTKHILASSHYHVDIEGVPKLLGVDRDITDEVENSNNLRETAEDLLRANERAALKNRELETAHELVEHHSLHDALTGLPNRRYLDKKLTNHLGHAGAAILHIDLDHFKQINDNLGHAAGDAVLIHVGEILSSNTAARDFVARVGGDEFVVFVNQATQVAGLKSMADRIVKKLSEPFMFEGQECRYGVSIGVSADPGPRCDTKQMMIDADIALYRAKDKGRNRFEFFTRALQNEVVTNKRRSDELIVALEEGDQLILHYQPQFDAQSLDIVCVEALARWQHPTEGMLYPDAFLKIAEDLSVVDMVDQASLVQSIADYEKWEAMGINIPKISVNVSAQRLHDDSLLERLGNLNFKPGTLSFELLESIFLDESDEIATWNIDHIKELGISIDVDDFGSGHASIVGLLNLRPERLKIDRQLVIPITESKQRRDLVKSIIEIGKSLGIHVVAEGVETAEHVTILQDLGCDTLQGYHFARPMSAEKLEVFVQGQAWRMAS